MTSPIFDVSSLISPELKRLVHTYNTSYPNDALEVLVSDDGGTSWNQIWYKAGADLESMMEPVLVPQGHLCFQEELTYLLMETI